MLNFGIDVSRDKLDCAVLDDQGQRVKRSRTFANDHQGVLDLIGSGRSVEVNQPRRHTMAAWSTPGRGARYGKTCSSSTPC
jgi:transposase